MANDSNGRFQTAQEMIEALDSFAVRAKLTGSNTAMGRFMVQLFGQKREPWVGGTSGSERTQVSDVAMHEPELDEKTLLVEGRQVPDVHRAPTAPGAGNAHWRQTGGRPALPLEPGPPTSASITPLRDVVGSPPHLKSEPGARPLVDDPLGWQGAQGAPYEPPGRGATRVPVGYQGSELRVVSRRGWIILIALLVTGLATGMLIAMLSS